MRNYVLCILLVAGCLRRRDAQWHGIDPALAACEASHPGESFRCVAGGQAYLCVWATTDGNQVSCAPVLR